MTLTEICTGYPRCMSVRIFTYLDYSARRTRAEWISGALPGVYGFFYPRFSFSSRIYTPKWFRRVATGEQQWAKWSYSWRPPYVSKSEKRIADFYARKRDTYYSGINHIPKITLLHYLSVILWANNCNVIVDVREGENKIDKKIYIV